MNTCSNCGKVAGLHSSILQGCMCQYSMQAPPQPQQETDAWHEIVLNQKQFLDKMELLLAKTTAPPQRTWVGLAAEDRLTAKYMQDAPDGIEAVIDYIEAKLKELNT